MKTIKTKALLAAALLCGGMGGIAEARSPEQIILAPDSAEALIVMQADWWQPAPSMQSAFKLTLSAYADQEGKLASNMFSGSVMIEAKQKSFVSGYLVTPIKPGRWVFQSYSQQDKWALCFNAASLQFDVKPGEVVYLGRFDAARHRQQLVSEAVNSGRTSIRGYGFADFFDLSAGPSFAPIDEGQMAALNEMLFSRMPGVTAPVRAVTFAPAQFGTGSTLFAERKCGGYFKQGTNPVEEKQ